MTDLQALCESWQAMLRLRDWDVTAEFVTPWDLRDTETQAELFHQMDKKTAKVQCLTEADLERQTDGLSPRPLEVNLVHELLHIHLLPFQPEHNTPEYTALEVAVDAISRALVQLKHGG